MFVNYILNFIYEKEIYFVIIESGLHEAFLQCLKTVDEVLQR